MHLYTNHSFSEEESAYFISLIENLKELIAIIEKGRGDYSNYSAPVLRVDPFDF